MCVAFNGLDVDSATVKRGAFLAERSWSNKYGTVNLEILSNEYNPIVMYEDENNFDKNYGEVGYFTWNDDLYGSPELHIKYSSDLKDDEKCMIGWNLGHEVLHIFVMTNGNKAHNHINKQIWLVAAGKEYKLTIEYQIYIEMVNFCGIEEKNLEKAR